MVITVEISTVMLGAIFFTVGALVGVLIAALIMAEKWK